MSLVGILQLADLDCKILSVTTWYWSVERDVIHIRA